MAYAAARLPRYTSYPTALQFGPLDAATFRAWLAAIRPGDALSLYVHIPFCKALCWYCGCHTSVTRSSARLARYGAALAREAGLLADALPHAAPVTHLHFGGGSPDALGAGGLASLLAALRGRFAMAPGAEIAAELDPRNLDQATVAALARGGLTRASLGVQDVSPEVQALIGRTQPTSLVESAVARLRAAGVGAINLDIMYGLPGQTVAHVEATARFVAAQGAARVAAFGYAHVPWMRPNQKAIDTSLLPDTAERLRQAEAIEAALRAAGYVAIGMDHFARPEDPLARAAASGRLRRNFQGYTDDDAPVLLPLGASAIGRTAQGFAQNEPDERRWLAAIEAGRLATARGLALTADDRLRAAVIETVMCRGEIATASVPSALLVEAAPRLQRLIADGLVRAEEQRLVATDEGRRFIRHFAACFDAYLAPGANRHSAAA
ncbi:MAG TPA: oxygen-independent coproporphyrinogen III oxidase [Acetobacteraceae bacterium]|nr:oxygen-independent coproporphyrinogen III oxidase [Acetobacteraceae bacterium]